MTREEQEIVSRERSQMAKQRLLAWRRRRENRGATIFLVTLVMTLLAAMGVFAARATSLSGKAAGYLRQSEQSHYLMQHAMVLALNEIDRGATVYGARNANSAVTNQACTTTAAYPSIKIPCVKFSTDWTKEDAFQAAVRRAQSANGKPLVKPVELPPTMNPDPAQNTAGSFGPWLLLPSMYVEMTDMAELERPPPGTAVSGNGSQFKYRQATLVGISQVGPYPANGPTAACASPEEKGAAMVVVRESGRSQIVFGPVN
ncbi:MAG: hypothetical protein RMJ98_01125 [Myxococcales bacterium]|nr:hypothetical protein [Polyangiaceae bacterium]MDW8247889.1 hypothetical protein [Myxococcales bacterium]